MIEVPVAFVTELCYVNAAIGSGNAVNF